MSAPPPSTPLYSTSGQIRGATVAAVVALLAAITFAAYARVGQCGFVNLDDDAYVEHQPMAHSGFRSATLAWAFLGTHSNNWHPLTTLSHQLDCAIFGLNPVPMHWENLAWHVLNTVLVFLVWRKVTGAFWRSALVALFFGVHPLHVESVAWISERKDLLSSFFWLVGLWAYARYAGERTLRQYLVVVAILVLALLSKPMAVTFPCTLLLLDFWPLARWPTKNWRTLLVEKLPLFGIVIAHAIVTFIVQHATGAGQFGERFSFWDRAGNAVVSYVRYVGKTLWPEALAPLYFHPGAWPFTSIAGALLVLAVVTCVVWRLRASRPWLLFGWLWFLGTLVPVIGFVQVGAQAIADRYMYFPILGLFTLLVWAFHELVQTRPQTRTPLIAGTAVAVGIFVAATSSQVTAWRNSISLHQHSIAVGEDNPAVRFLLATASQAAGRPASEIAAHCQRALELRPDYINATTLLAGIALAESRFDDARRIVEKQLRADPANTAMHINLGAIFMRQGNNDGAIPHFEEALRLDPSSLNAHLELGKILFWQGRTQDALPHFEKRARALRWDPAAQADYGALLLSHRRFEEARPYLQRALWLRPDFQQARANLDVLDQATRRNN